MVVWRPVFSSWRPGVLRFRLAHAALVATRAARETSIAVFNCHGRLPVNAMFCDRELILRYLNRASRKTLLSLQQHLPCR